MERSTKKDKSGHYLIGDGIYGDWGVPEKFRGADVDRLAAYEDTGLEPEEITANMEMFAAYRHVCGGLPPEKVSELVEAEQKRREGCEFCVGDKSIYPRIFNICNVPHKSFCPECGRDLRGESHDGN